EHVLAPAADVLQGSRLYDLGDVGQGAGEPAGVAVRADGTVIVALAGTNEVALGTLAKGDWARLPVGRRPTAMALSPDSNRALIANTFDDSVTILDVAGRKVVATVSLG